MFNFYHNNKSLKLLIVMFISVAVLYEDLKYELSIDYKPFKNYLVYSNLEMKTKKYKTKRIKGTYKGNSGVKTHKLKRIPSKKKKYYPRRLLKFIYNEVLRKNKSHNGASKKNKVSRDVDEVLVQKVPDSCESEVNELNKILQDSRGNPDISSELTKIEKSISEEECTPELLNYLRDFIVLLFSRRTVLENIVDENQHTCQHNHSNNYLCDLCSTKQKLLKDLHERRNNTSRDMETILKIIKECIHIINKYDMIHYQYKKHNNINEEKCSKDDFMRLVREYEELIVQEHINRCFYDYNKQSLDKCTKCKSEMLVSNICRICTSTNNSRNNLYKVINIIEIEIQGKLTQIFQCENYLFNLINRNILRTASERRNWQKGIYKRQLQEIKANNKISTEEPNDKVSLGSQDMSVIEQLTNFGINTRNFFSDISSIFKEKEEAKEIALENQIKAKLESIRNKAEIEEQKHIKINSELKQGVCTEDSLKTFLKKKDKYLKCFNSSLTSFVRCNINCNDKNCYLCEQETISKRKRCFYKLQEIKEKLILCLKINGWTLEDIEKELKDILDIE